MRTILAVLMVVGCSSCAQVRTTPVQPLTFSTPLASDLNGQTVRVQLLDARAGEHENDPSTAIFETLRQANPTPNWVRVKPDEVSEVDLTIKTLVFESTFSLGNWTGTVELAVEWHNTKVDSRFTVQRAVTFSNMLGYQTADDALKKAFQQAMSELVGKL